MVAVKEHVCAYGYDNDEAPNDVTAASVYAAVQSRGETGDQDNEDDDEGAARNGQETLVELWEGREERGFYRLCRAPG